MMTQDILKVPDSVLKLKRLLAKALVRSGIDYTDDVLILNALFGDFRWEKGVEPKRAAAEWREHLDNRQRAAVLSVYAHIPYCVKKCFFCECAMRVTTDQSLIDEYVPHLRREIEFYAPLFSGVSVDILQIGGGTPSLLSAPRLKECLESLTSAFSIRKNAMRVIEFNPASTTPEKLSAARASGFNRISFGVQSLNARVLKNENREYQTYEMTRNAVQWARNEGFEAINVDLILGLEHDTLDGFLEGFRRAAELGPTSIVVPGLTMTDSYLKVMKLTREENHRRYERLVPPALEGMRRISEELGYDASELTSDRGTWFVHAKGTPSYLLKGMSRSDHFEGGAVSVLGLGHFARSFLFERAIYERYPKPFEAQSPMYRRAAMSRRDEMMRYMLCALDNHSRIDFGGFKQRFGGDLREEFAIELKALKCMGKVRMESNGFRFLPVRGPERIFYALFFLRNLVFSLPLARDLFDPNMEKALARDLSLIDLGTESAACR